MYHKGSCFKAVTVHNTDIKTGRNIDLMLISSSSALTVDFFFTQYAKWELKSNCQFKKKNLLITKQTCKPVRLAHMAEKLHGGANK